jgi:hypothetical protein
MMLLYYQQDLPIKALVLGKRVYEEDIRMSNCIYIASIQSSPARSLTS